ncbi:MFS transporter [Marivibrio halodurans]|uniref:MFS transporter n=1 Tax=Marivibrio halodurans TaxID=2039722 RepID=A0A8J7S4R5_9PROT|nr:MFS transporter [Marivibrio halodurans]MBP5858764.1 MFS transporter [Marivibrio halodurans]
MRAPSFLSRWLGAAALYGDRRVLAIAAMGSASGLPYVLIVSTLGYWLARLEVDLAAIGIFGLVALPYAWKVLWAPVIDRARPPVPFRALGRRRGWAVPIQLALAGAILALGFTDPAEAPAMVAVLALAVGFLGASQDVVIDAVRIELLREDEQGAGAAATQLGWRIGGLIAGAGAIGLSDFVGWPVVFAVMAGAVLVGMLALILVGEPESAGAREVLDGPRPAPATALRRAVIEPFREFLTRPQALAILVFALLYKFGDAIGGAMANPFYVDLGFTGAEIAAVTKLFGLGATVAGVLGGGLLVRGYGLYPALMIGGVAQAATNLAFTWLALAGTDIGVLTVAIAVDNFAGGLGSAAFVAYLSALCDARFTATQYALLTSVMAQGRSLMAAGSGFLAEFLGWPAFFATTALLAVPGLLLLLHLMARRPERA